MNFPTAVRFCHPDAGSIWDQMRTTEHGLITGEIYILRKVEVGQSSTAMAARSCQERNSVKTLLSKEIMKRMLS